MIIRKFLETDVFEVLKIIHRNLLEVNIKDYTEKEMIKFSNYYSKEKILEIATNGNFYIAEENSKILGCCAILKSDEFNSLISTFFILPELHKKYIGRFLLNEVEKDLNFINAKKIFVDASITSHMFYKKMGYEYCGGIEKSFTGENYKMEKINN